MQLMLADWVGDGHDPYSSNRYGFINTATQEYLDFATGELKACQIIEIMTGESPPAVCTYNEFGEPLPHK